MKYTSLLFGALLITLTACGLLGSGGSSPNIPGKLVFAAEDSAGNYQIFTMKASGSGLKQLTNLEEDEAYQPSWSPDGSQIVFSTTLRSSSNGLSLYVMNADGSDMRALNERENSHIPSPGNNPQWSPDGTRIVFDRCVNCQIGTNLELFIYDFETDSVIRLTDNKSSESNPTWSPDGQRIAFTSDRDYFDGDTLRFRKDLYVIDADGKNLQRLTNNGFVGSLDWHPDGTQIVFAANGIHIYSFDKNEVTKFNIEISNVRPVNWSGDGKFILLAAFDQQRQTNLYLLNINNETTKSLKSEPQQFSGIDWYSRES